MNQESERVTTDSESFDIVHVAENEWDHEDGACKRAAREHFEAYADAKFVLVDEHAGWFLGYRRDLTIWCTANDRATLEQPSPKPTRYSGRTVRREASITKVDA